jgi:TPR repeat protein
MLTKRILHFVASRLTLAFGLLFGFPIHSLAVPGIDPDIPRMQAAADKGVIHDQIALGDAYFIGRGVSQDLKLAAYWYEKAAGSGDPTAQNQIGYLYQVGLGVPADATRAVHWYQLSAAAGSTTAKVNLGVAYFWGIGVTKDPQLAEQLLREAANKGNAIACTYLGDMYYFGVGVPMDKNTAEAWFEKGTKLHNYLAAFRMASILSQPGDHPRDIQRAYSLFRESAAAGFVPAMHSLGLLLVNHPEFGASHEEALSLLTKSANAGTWKSSVVLGALARDGKFVPQDDKAAYFHFRAAVEQGGESAKAMLHNDLQVLSKRIGAAQRNSIDKEAGEWVQKHRIPLQMIYKGAEGATRFPMFALALPPDGAHAGSLVPVTSF